MKEPKHREKLHISYFQRIFLSFLAVTIILTSALTSFLTANYKNNMTVTVSNLNNKLLSQSTYSVTYINELAQSLSNTLYINSDIVNFLYANSADTMTAIRANNTLNRLTISNPYVESVYLYNANIDLFLSSKTGGQYSTEKFYDKEISELLNNPTFLKNYTGKPFPRCTDSDLDFPDLYSFFLYDRKAVHTDQKTSALVINIHTDTLTQTIASINALNDSFHSQLIVVDAEGTIIGEKTDEDILNAPDLSKLIQKVIAADNHIDTLVESIDGNKYLISFQKTPQSDWYFISFTLYSEVLGNINTTTVFSILIVIMIFLLVALVCLFLSKQLHRPLKAITQIVKLQYNQEDAALSLQKDEFQFLSEVFSSMNEQATRFDQFRHETLYSMKKDFLKDIVSNTLSMPQKKIEQNLEYLNLSYLLTDHLCMCVLKIDSYSTFKSLNNQKERWALRFAIVNITNELISKKFTCEAFSMDSDKCVVLIDTEQNEDFISFCNELESILKEIQEQVQINLNLSLSVAYSTFFKGIDHVSRMYNNLLELLQLKFKYGHKCILNPYMIENVEFADIEIPYSKEELLLEKISHSNLDAAKEVYQTIIRSITPYSYSEILSYIMHLCYTIYAFVQSSNKSLKDEFIPIYKKVLKELEETETLNEVNEHFLDFLEKLSECMKQSKENQLSNNQDVIVNGIIDIIQKKYARKDLCLNSIAEEMNMSPAYIGRIFRESEKKSIAKYISDYRMNLVGEYLKRGEQSISDILDKVGLEKNNYFYTTFKRHFGISLGEFKLNLLGAGDPAQPPKK